MSASSTTGKGQGSCRKMNNSELSLIANSPAIVIADSVTSDVVGLLSPVTTGATVVFTTPLDGAASDYVIILTPLGAETAYLVDVDEAGGKVTGFDLITSGICEVHYVVVKKGLRPSVIQDS